MGSASREALKRAQASLEARIHTVSGVELLSASAEIAASPALLAALSDASAVAGAKGQLVTSLFHSAGAGTLQVLSEIVSESWSTPAELVDGIEELGLRAEAAAHPNLADELLAAAAVIDSNHDLELTLGSKLGNNAAKADMTNKLFAGKLSESTVAVVAHLVSSPRGRKPSVSIRTSAKIAADQGGSELATVTVASAMNADQQARLAAMLETSVGRKVHVTTIINPDLIGGVRVQIGDDVIDGSIRSRLDDLRLQLAG